MKKILVPLLVAMAVLVGCGTAGRSYVDTEMVETLEVEILPNASKMFTYRLRWPEDHIPSHIRVDRGGGGDARREFQKGGVDVGRGTYERLVENTAYVVEHSGYCREGFFELDRSISRYHLWVRGECKDGATSADQNTFGAKQTLGPERWGKS
ncbi:hypothetical protein [Cellvibrio mixtus]|uniref:hypothetical protein n=1 Tax=Cellvibrio mixtus TaxID=39650 RepID=UPI0005865791|nr:hypothetical protein [Cellvibrio mixtus]